jgi:two-component system response regulator
MRPAIILLDLNMPGTDGRTALKEIKTDPKLKDIPVVVLTTSNDHIDIDACYEDGANTYIHKPVDLDGFFSAIKQLKEYWFEVAILPKTIE